MKIKRGFFEIALFLLTFIIFIVNAMYMAYPDEFVNLLGGQAINQGKIPYVDFFDHHLPFAWYLSAILLKFAGHSFVLFRYIWAGFLFAGLLLLAFWMRKNYKELYPYYLVFFFIYPLFSLYFWLHLYIADSLAVFFFSLTFWILFAQTITNRVHFPALIASSLLIFSLIFSSLTYLYLALALYAWLVVLGGFNTKRLVQIGTWIIAPYVLYGTYLLLSGSFKDFYFSNVTYNSDLYISIPNYVKGRLFNPLKFGLTLIFNFFTNYLPLLTQVKYLDLYLPVGVLAGISSFVLFGLLAFRNILYGGIFFFILSFSAPRSNIQKLNETDYQMGVFLALGIISALFVMYLLRENKFKDVLIQDILRIAHIIIVILFIFTGVFLLANTYNKYYLRYTQKMPSVNNLAHTASLVDAILEKGDYYWAGPFEPSEEFFVREAKLPGKYPTLLPQFAERDYLRQSFIGQFEKNRPKIIIFRHEASIFNTPADRFGDFFLEWMKGKYTAIEHIKGVTVTKSPSTFNIKSDLYLLNSEQSSLIQKLRENGFIQ
ncbi:hypothetical protein HY358_02540 [Candidatus Roizmanbacteria bacterium]|nr:hypothetical protein [Candidatus Roizmanbacteria bacterium]